MQRGNPYHDSRGRFTSPYGAYRTSMDAKDIKRSIEDELESMEEYDHEYGNDDADVNLREAEVEEQVNQIYSEYNNEARQRISKMDYNELRQFTDSDEDIQSAVLKKHQKWLDENSHENEVDGENVVNSAAEAFDMDVVDYRYRRIVAKCNGKYKLFAMASDEEGGYGVNGYTYDYATQRVKALGLGGEFENYKAAKEAYARGDQALGKSPSEYKDEGAYIRAKMKYYSQVDDERAQRQFKAIQATNPMKDDIHTGIRSPKDIKSFSQAMDFTDDAAPDFTAEDARNARQSGFVTVFSSKPIQVGSFVTPSRMEAESYAGGGQVYSQRVSIDSVAWIDGIEGQLAE